VPLVHLAISFSIVITLKWHKESKWRVFAMYVLIAEEIIIEIISIFLTGGDKQTEGYFYASVMVINVFFCFYIFISALLVKNKLISIYFKLYGTCLFVGITSVLVLQTVLAYYHLSSIVYTSICSFLFIMHTIPLLVMYINLHNKNAMFRQGDLIITKKGLENVPAGTQGAIITKHTDAGYYEAEFFDAHGNLLNTLTVSSKDFEHAQMPDLQTRVNNFRS